VAGTHIIANTFDVDKLNQDDTVKGRTVEKSPYTECFGTVCPFVCLLNDQYKDLAMLASGDVDDCKTEGRTLNSKLYDLTGKSKEFHVDQNKLRENHLMTSSVNSDSMGKIIN